ncbi:hypothetical protein K438DRAFT_2019977 [Mycena galopus ATCC 62051]|nr:hypothetical protein K438DRAFT_2019977 [Mycena galopus ATCC 62051]
MMCPNSSLFSPSLGYYVDDPSRAPIADPDPMTDKKCIFSASLMSYIVAPDAPANTVPVLPSSGAHVARNIMPHPQISAPRFHPYLPSSSPGQPCDPCYVAESVLPHKRARKPRTGNELTQSPYRPHVPADRRILRWTAPWSTALDQRQRGKHIDNAMQAKIYQVLLLATTEGTRESYGAGLLRFLQYCDAHGIEEESCMPADVDIVAAFVASAVGTCSGKCIRNWLNGLRLWHLYNHAPWCGKDLILRELKKGADRGGIDFKRPPREPVTIAHMRAVLAYLDTNGGFGSAAWAAATSRLWGCR